MSAHLAVPEAVQRWEDFGGTWAIVQATSSYAIVSLCRCDGGEVAEQLTLTDAADCAWASQELKNDA